ncbi:MAG: UDP-N-acetylmuramoyl-tripeptide--D-alanyl-D-alanine ligase [Nitrospinota bacterium]|nr:UDP-N-acetylmuramoyl-tripeptide--D-alanyl-D-alanine ligase [Nitrospinota bacterium]
MARFSIGQLIKAVGGELAEGSVDTVVNGVSTDSRRITRGCLFVAILGPRVDGHDFVRQAFTKGASAALVSHKLVVASSPGKAMVAAPDTTRALLDLAAWHRAEMKNLLVAAVTGSNGKTGVKDMVAAILAKKYKTLKTEGNLNNQIGLPTTLLGLNTAHQAAVVELGINYIGEMDLLAAAARPDIGVITNIGPAHLEGLKTVDNVRKTKARMLDFMTDNGTAILNASDPNSAPIIKARKGQKTITFGICEGDVAVVENVLAKTLTGRKIKIRWNGEVHVMKVRWIGKSAAINAAAAFAVGVAAAAPPEMIVKAIGSARPERLRMALEKLSGGAWLIDDSYNANPASVEAALSTLSEFGERRKFLIFGDMLEMGKAAEKAHAAVARQAKAFGVERIFTYGPLAAITAMEAKKVGLVSVERKSHEALARAVTSALMPGDVALVKGSRGMQMDKVAELIRHGAKGK